MKKKYKVTWEVSKHALVDANSAEDAIKKAMEGEIASYEDEITASPEAYIIA